MWSLRKLFFNLPFFKASQGFLEAYSSLDKLSSSDQSEKYSTTASKTSGGCITPHGSRDACIFSLAQPQSMSEPAPSTKYAVGILSHVMLISSDKSYCQLIF